MHVWVLLEIWDAEGIITVTGAYSSLKSAEWSLIERMNEVLEEEFGEEIGNLSEKEKKDLLNTHDFHFEIHETFCH